MTTTTHARAPWRAVTRSELRKGAVYALLLFGALGTVTALWPNPLFTRMTPVGPLDYGILGLEAALLGLYLGLRGGACAVKGAGVGGLLGLQGFGCSLCNKLLVLAFGAPALLAWYEPYRHYVGGAGLAVLALAVWIKLQRRNPPPGGVANATPALHRAA